MAADRTTPTRGFIAPALVMALLATPSLASAQISLAKVVELAQQNSVAVHLAQANLDKARAAFSESRDAVIPSLSVSTGVPTFPSVGFTGTPSSIISASIQSLIFGIPQKHYINSASFAVKSAREALADAMEQVALDASNDYVELDTVTAEVRVIDQQLESAALLVEIEQQRGEAGVDPYSALLEAQLTQAEMRLRKAHLQAQAEQLTAELASLTGLHSEAIATDHASIPEIPRIHAVARVLPGIAAQRLLAESKLQQAQGDDKINYLPQLSFGAQYYRHTSLLNEEDNYFKSPLPVNNFTSGISVQVPIFNIGGHAKARESAADALKARIEAEQSQQQNDQAIAKMSSSIRELDALAEVSRLKQEIAAEQLKTVEAELTTGNGSDQPQLSPKAEQLARIDQGQKQQDSLEAQLSLDKARLGLLRALGHMSDWLNELKTK